MANFYLEPPTGLLENIVNRIRKEERVLVLKKTALFSIVFMASVAGIMPSLNLLVSDFSKSGFINFFSLIFSDFSSIVAYWQSFLMILLETLPAISLALFLAVLLALLESSVVLVKNVKLIINNNRLAIN